MGHAEGSLPTAQAQLDVLANLVQRWTPEHLHRERLDTTLRGIQQRTRAECDENESELGVQPQEGFPAKLLCLLVARAKKQQITEHVVPQGFVEFGNLVLKRSSAF